MCVSKAACANMTQVQKFWPEEWREIPANLCQLVEGRPKPKSYSLKGNTKGMCVNLKNFRKVKKYLKVLSFIKLAFHKQNYFK